MPPPANTADTSLVLRFELARDGAYRTLRVWISDGVDPTISVQYRDQFELRLETLVMNRIRGLLQRLEQQTKLNQPKQHED